MDHTLEWTRLLDVCEPLSLQAPERIVGGFHACSTKASQLPVSGKGRANNEK